MRRWARKWIATCVVFVACASSWAQDYTVTTATGQLEARPAGAVRLGCTSSTVGASHGTSSTVALPFEFPYFGEICTTIVVGAGGFIVPGASGTITNTDYNAVPRGAAAGGAFPYSTVSDTTNVDGIAAPFWDDIAYVNDGSANTGYAYTWTTGTAPARRFVVSWENVQIGSTANPRVTFQIHLHEVTGRITFAYAANTTGFNFSQYVCGIDSPLDSRFDIPPGRTASHVNTGHPGSDFLFDPRPVTCTGTLLYDKLVSDASGIGKTVDTNRPVAGCRVEFRNGGVVAAHVLTASDGTFSVKGLALPSTATGTLALLAQSDSCRVSTSGASPATEWTVSASVPCSADSAVGTVTLGTVSDPSGSVRAAINVARACGTARAWVIARTNDAVAGLDVGLDQSDGSATRYVRVSPAGTPLLRVAGNASGNVDAWDDAVVTRAYARHVLASIAALPATTADDRFDAATDTENAFAEAFGYYLWAVVSGSSTAIDGTSANAATVHDLETPTVTVTRGPDVAGCVAGALYDLLDDASEARDAVDGTLTQGRVFQITDGFTVAPTANTFQQAWIDAGHDASSIARTFIGDGVVADDASEPNDDRNEAAPLGAVGVRRTAFMLNRFNDDWFSVTLPSGGTSLRADVVYDRLAVNTAVALEIRDASGSLLANGSAVGTTGPIHAETAGVAAGSYRIGVRYTSGAKLPAYAVQAYLPLVMDQAPLTDWTVGRAFDQTLGVAGGVPGYTLATAGSALPPGLSFNPLDQHVVGTPTTVGSFGFTIQLQDTGLPANFVTRTRNIVIHDVLKVAIAPFVGFPLTKSADTTLPTTGGTPPFTLSMTAGALPAGLAFDPNSLHVTGTVTAGPSATFELDGVDVAGSADHVATRGVIAAQFLGKNVPADLVAGTDACGWWFDAVQGSKVSFTAATAKRRVKRTLVGAVLAPDRSLVLTGRIKAKLGSLWGGGIVCPLSGRYYVIASSDTGDATQLLGNVHVSPPKSGKAKIPVFAPSDTTTVEVGAVPGAVLTLKFAGQKKTTLVAKIVGVTDPTGTPVGTAQFVKPSATGGTLTMTLPTGGTWTFVLGATSTSGVPGKFSYSYSIKQPKGVTYSAD